MCFSISSMICIALTFGAPERVPAGSAERSTSIAPIPSRSLPETWLTMWSTWE